MSCRTTSGGSVSTSLARAVSGLTDAEVQHVFHALKREGEGLPMPSELDVVEWRSRQYDLLTRMKKMPDTRRDKLRDKLFRSRSEPVPDGATFYAWSRVESRARQESALREIDTAVDLDPPGSQADLYDLDENGRPRRVWYASYGSNLHRDRFLTYIKGGKPEGSTRTYDGCTDKSEPAGDIPIRFAGARPHFALTSRVWHGGIAFLDNPKGETSHGLGRAYDISIDQFDEVVAQENGLSTKWASEVPLKEVLTTGRSVVGEGTYETILHIGDYDGAPVLTFTAPFSTREAVTRTGSINRTLAPPLPTAAEKAKNITPQPSTVRMPVMTNKPSAAYLRMIGSGLKETFGMDEVAQADYLRGCPGGDRWTRQQMVRILRGQSPDPAPAPDPAKATSSKVTSVPAKGKGKGRRRGKRSDDEPIPSLGHAGAVDTAEGNRERWRQDMQDWENRRYGTQSPRTESRSSSLSVQFSGDDDTPMALTGACKDDDEPGFVVTKSAVDDIRSTRSPTTRPRTTSTSMAGRGGASTSPKQPPAPKELDLSTRLHPQTGLPMKNSANAGVKRYTSGEEQSAGVRRWATQVTKDQNVRDQTRHRVRSWQTLLEADKAQGVSADRIAATEMNLRKAEAKLAEDEQILADTRARLRAAKAQQPARYYDHTRARTVDQWRDEDSRVLGEHQAVEVELSRRARAIAELEKVKDPNKDLVNTLSASRGRVTMLTRKKAELEQRLSELKAILDPKLSR